MIMRQLGQRTHIGDLGQRIGRRFQEQHACLRAYRPLPVRLIGHFGKAGIDAEPGQILVEEARGAAENRTRTDDMVTGAQQRHAQAGDRRHPRRGRDTGFTALQRGQALLEGWPVF